MTTIYVLECEEGKFYVGRTDRNVSLRIDEHFSSSGSEWTKKYKPIRVIKTIKDADLLDEDKYTKIYMQKYGIDNVRGGSYTTLILPSYKVKCLHDEIATAESKCFRCGRTGHFIKECYAKIHENGSLILNEKASAKEKTIDKIRTVPKEKDIAKTSATPQKKDIAKTSAAPKEKDIAKRNTTPKDESSSKEKGLIKEKAIAKGSTVPKEKVYAPQGKCSRCGRRGHNIRKCYAKTHEDGSSLQDKSSQEEPNKQESQTAEPKKEKHQIAEPKKEEPQKEEDPSCMIM